MGGIRFSVCGCQSENPFVCFGAQPTQTAYARDLTRDRKDKGEDGRKQSAEGGRRDQSGRCESGRE